MKVEGLVVVMVVLDVVVVDGVVMVFDVLEVVMVRLWTLVVRELLLRLKTSTVENVYSKK